METMNLRTRPDRIFFSFIQDEKVIIMGSRKVNEIELNLEFDSLDITHFGSPERIYEYINPEYRLNGSMQGFIQVTGNSFEEAMFNLLLAFREEERKEEEAREAARLAAENWTRSPSASGSVSFRCSDPECSCEDDDWDYYDRDYDDETYDDTIYDDYDYDDDCDCYWCQRS